MSEKKRNQNAALKLTGAMQSKPKANTKRNTSAKQKAGLERRNLVQKNFSIPDETADNLDLLQLRLRRMLGERGAISYSTIVSNLIDAAFEDFKDNGESSYVVLKFREMLEK